MPDYNQLMQGYNTRLAEQRLLMSQWCTTVVSQYKALPDDIKAQLPALPGDSAQTLVPALYADPITPEAARQYTEQIAVLDGFVAACNAKISELNNLEAVRCKLL